MEEVVVEGDCWNVNLLFDSWIGKGFFLAGQGDLQSVILPGALIVEGR